MSKVKKIEKEIVELITKWYSHKVVFPKSWSDERFLSELPVSYKTYDSGSIGYVDIDIKVNMIQYSVKLRHGNILIVSPLTNQISANKLLELLTSIYEESVSIKSIVEGQSNLREEIAKKKDQLKNINKAIKELEGRLQ